MNIEDIKRLPISELNELGKKLDVPGASGMRRQELIFAILQTQAERYFRLRRSGNFAGWIRLFTSHRLQLPAQS